MNEMNIPAIRFAGFAEDWEKRKLSAIASIKARIGWQGLTQKEFLDGGDYYLITGTDFAEGTIDFPNCHYIGEDRYKQDTNIQVKARDVLITKDGTIGKVAYIKELDKPATLNAGVFVIRGRDESTSNLYMYHYLAAPFLLDYADEQATGGTIKHLNQNVLVNFPVPMPSVAEQEKVGQFFSAVNDLITLHQREHDKTVNIKKALLEKMFPKAGEDKPEIRFAGFTDAWEQRKLGEITSEFSGYATLEAGLPLFTSARSGLMYQCEYRGNQTTDSKKTLFSVVPLNACTYRHMSDDDVFHMNINTLEKGLVSREYPVFLSTEGNDLNFIIQHLNSSSPFRAFCKEQKKGGTRTRLYYEALCEFTMQVPTPTEQKRISRCLLTLDDLLTLHQRELTKLQNIKKALLEKMFV